MRWQQVLDGADDVAMESYRCCKYSWPVISLILIIPALVGWLMYVAPINDCIGFDGLQAPQCSQLTPPDGSDGNTPTCCNYWCCGAERDAEVYEPGYAAEFELTQAPMATPVTVDDDRVTPSKCAQLFSEQGRSDVCGCVTRQNGRNQESICGVVHLEGAFAKYTPCENCWGPSLGVLFFVAVSIPWLMHCGVFCSKYPNAMKAYFRRELEGTGISVHYIMGGKHEPNLLEFTYPANGGSRNGGSRSGTGNDSVRMDQLGPGGQPQMYAVTVPHGVNSGQSFQVNVGGQNVAVSMTPQMYAGQQITVQGPGPV
jgi:hypothetical protein